MLSGDLTPNPGYLSQPDPYLIYAALGQKAYRELIELIFVRMCGLGAKPTTRLW